MSNSSETGLDLEELELELLPAWAKQSPDTNRYAKYEGGDAASGPRGRERRGQPPGRSDRRQGEERGRARPRTSRDERPGAPRREGGGRSDRERGDERREPAQPLPDLSVNFV